MHPYLEAARERVVVYDGATGTNLQARDLSADDFGGPALEGCNEVLVDTRPDVVADLHRSFFDIGSDVVETDTFGAFSVVLAEYDIAERAHELNVKAAQIAKEVASGYGGWVAGSMGPGTKLPSLGQIRFADLRDAYEVQALGLLEGGVDLLLVETVYDLLQAKAAMIACRRAMAAVGRDVPLQVQVTMETTGRMLVGTEIGAALTALEALRPDVFGLNCATGPVEMGEHLRHLSQHCTAPISCLPNAGLPSVVEGKTHYDLTAEQLADHHARFVTEFGVSIVGGCCGTTPEHLSQVVERVRSLTPASRSIVDEPGAASIYTAVPFHQDTSFLVIGERTNANGSKKFREAMLEADWDTCLAMAREQVKEGAHVLDVCVDYVGRDGTADMDEIASRFATQVSAPLVMDSTESPVLEAGLQWVGGPAIVHAARIMPLNRIDERQRQVALDLVYDRRSEGYDPLQELLAIFEDVTAADVEKEDRSGWPVEERLKHRIIDGDRDGLEADLDEALATRPALSIVNDVLLEGMKVVGDLFASGEMQLPFVLQSAECMKAAVASLEPHMEKADQGGKGRVVLGTVKGDVHDIGKNLVDIILTNNGYEVFNLGIKVPIGELVAKAEEVTADAIGMSGLLVKSTLIMIENLEA